MLYPIAFNPLAFSLILILSIVPVLVTDWLFLGEFTNSLIKTISPTSITLTYLWSYWCVWHHLCPFGSCIWREEEALWRKGPGGGRLFQPRTADPPAVPMPAPPAALLWSFPPAYSVKNTTTGHMGCIKYLSNILWWNHTLWHTFVLCYLCELGQEAYSAIKILMQIQPRSRRSFLRSSVLIRRGEEVSDARSCPGSVLKL